MKKILSSIILAAVLLFAFNVRAEPKCTKNMLDQIGDINGSYRPIVGNSLYVVTKKNLVVVVVRLYNTNNMDADPEETDAQAVFVKTKAHCKLAALTFSPIDVTKYIDLLVE